MKIIDDKGATIAESTHVHVGWNPVEKTVKVAMLVGEDEAASVPATLVIPINQLDELLPELAIASNELRHIERGDRSEITVSVVAPGGDFLNAIAADLFRTMAQFNAARRDDGQAQSDAPDGASEPGAGMGGGTYDGRHG